MAAELHTSLQHLSLLMLPYFVLHNFLSNRLRAYLNKLSVFITLKLFMNYLESWVHFFLLCVDRPDR